MSVMLKCDVALDYANTLGIYAVPTNGSYGRYWRPRMPNGKDPSGLAWLEIEQQHPFGWRKWEDAVLALGDHLTGKEPTDGNTV